MNLIKVVLLSALLLYRVHAFDEQETEECLNINRDTDNLAELCTKLGKTRERILVLQRRIEVSSYDKKQTDRLLEILLDTSSEIKKMEERIENNEISIEETFGTIKSIAMKIDDEAKAEECQEEQSGKAGALDYLCQKESEMYSQHSSVLQKISRAKETSDLFEKMEFYRSKHDRELENREIVKKERNLLIEKAEKLLVNSTEHIEKLQKIRESQSFEHHKEITVKREEVAFEASPRYAVSYKNITLTKLQNRNYFLLNKIVCMFYAMNRKSIEENHKSISEKIQRLLIYNYDSTHIDYLSKIDKFIDSVKDYHGDKKRDRDLADALDAHFLSLLLFDETRDEKRLVQVLDILYELYDKNYSAANSPSFKTLQDFQEYFYDLLDVHLLLTEGGDTLETEEISDMLFSNLRKFINTFPSQEGIHAISRTLKKLDSSFLEYNYHPVIETEKEYDTQNKKKPWKYSKCDKYSRIHHCMSAHDPEHFGFLSIRLVHLHPLIAAAKEKIIPMWIINKNERNPDECTAEFGYTSLEECVYSTDLLTYADACLFAMATTVELVIDTDLPDEIAYAIAKHTNPKARVSFIRLNLNANDLFTDKESIHMLDHTPTSENKQEVYNLVLDKILENRWLFWPLFAITTIAGIILNLLLGDACVFFTVIPILIYSSGVLRAFVVSLKMEVHYVNMAFNILSAGFLFLVCAYGCDIFFRASELTENLSCIKWMYFVCSAVGIVGLLSTYSKKGRRYVYGKKYWISNIFKYAYYAMAILCALSIPAIYASFGENRDEILSVLMACNVGMFSGIFLYVGCSYEKMQVKIETDQWKKLDWWVMCLAYSTTGIALLSTLGICIKYDLLENIPVVLGGKRVYVSMFSENKLPFYHIADVQAYSQSSLVTAFNAVVEETSKRINRITSSDGAEINYY
ncbi:hypothetical protein NEMIN01_2171 [Nematocida minor]|uniref:uncharacterized protein n=1 Tax=Nematocida minor TaxID=1912983 RepID=UPI0022209AA2|nr:uncharacterized protein NEMIN01_2171 [Nematocida minor]KAI5192714.1 hypothetical protein NEMIN01_2171 [Nematocida minor]